MKNTFVMLWLWLGLACAGAAAQQRIELPSLDALSGTADDWTPAAPCKALVAAAGPRVESQAYAGASLGFYSTVAVRLETFIRDTWSLAR